MHAWSSFTCLQEAKSRFPDLFRVSSFETRSGLQEFFSASWLSIGVFLAQPLAEDTRRTREESIQAQMNSVDIDGDEFDPAALSELERFSNVFFQTGGVAVVSPDNIALRQLIQAGVLDVNELKLSSTTSANSEANPVAPQEEEETTPLLLPDDTSLVIFNFLTGRVAFTTFVCFVCLPLACPITYIPVIARA